jgi:hypothetical protein
MDNSHQEEKSGLAQAILTGIDTVLEGVHTAHPCIVDKVNPDGTVAVLPTIATEIIVDGELVSKPLPKIPNVPVHKTQIGKYRIRAKPVKGDEGLLIFSERAISDWRKFGDIRVPSNRRMHNLTDAFFLPGGSSSANILPNDEDGLILEHEDGTSIVLKEAGKVAVKNTTGELFDLLTQALDAIATSTCPPGSPLTGAAAVTALSTQLKSFITATPEEEV